MDISSAVFWVALGQIVWINIILSGDNAVVIALAARSLPPAQQKKAVIWGSGAAVVLRVALTIVAAYMLTLPYLQIVGGLLLLWIGVQLLAEQDEDDGEEKKHGTLMAAVRTILVADLVMSLDNVIAVALAAKIDGQVNYTLLILGLAVSIPMVVFGSTMMIRLMARFPVIVVLGAALIGWVAGDAIAHDVAVHDVFAGSQVALYGLKAACAVAVVAAGKWLASRAQAQDKAGNQQVAESEAGN
jgi:YjbE family integral membrane protein